MEVKYRKIWRQFLETEAAEFVEKRKLPLKDIKKIGATKFIKANGWETPEDVSKWRTDVLEIVPCPHCSNDFGVLDDGMGLCESCLPQFDLLKFYKQMVDACGEDATKMGKMIIFFMSDKNFRRHYLKIREGSST